MSSKFHLVLSTVAILFALFTAPAAKACRDCPFPMKIGNNQWLLPEGMILRMQESCISTSKTLVVVILQDPNTGEVLADGEIVRPKKQKSVEVMLWDGRGRRVSGSIYWEDFTRPLIRARFTCLDANCSIKDKI